MGTLLFCRFLRLRGFRGRLIGFQLVQLLPQLRVFRKQPAQLLLHGDELLFDLAVGENGRVILSDHSGSAAKDTYWKTDSPALYRSLLSVAGTES